MITQIERILKVVRASIDRVRARNFWVHINGNLIWTGVESNTREVEHTDPRTILDNLDNYLGGVRPEYSINEWAELIGEWGREKGWTFEERDIPEKLMLVCTELSEAMEEYRRPGFSASHVYFNEDGKPEGFGVEVADALIRILHLANHLQLDMNDLVQRKMEYNAKRPFRHGKRA